MSTIIILEYYNIDILVQLHWSFYFYFYTTYGYLWITYGYLYYYIFF